MFDDLSKTDWTSLQHVYSSSDAIPDSMRSLLSNNPEEITDALDFLFGVGQDTGTIAETTPLIIPYAQALLGKMDAASTAEMLIKLAAVAENMTRPWQFTFRRQRNVVKTYDALVKGLQTYFPLLNHDELNIRYWTVELLQYLTEDNAVLIAAELRQRFDLEPEETAKVQIIEKLASIVKRLPALEAPEVILRQQYANFYRHLVLSEIPSSPRIRAVAALASLKIFYVPADSISPTIFQILSQHFLAEMDAYKKREIIEALSKWTAEPLLELLVNPNITSEDAHLIVRGILASIFARYNEKHWEYNPEWRKEATGKFYAIHEQAPATLWSYAKFLMPIVNSDKFWEIPTNLFSVFYALPDSREALRAALEKPDD